MAWERYGNLRIGEAMMHAGGSVTPGEETVREVQKKVEKMESCGEGRR